MTEFRPDRTTYIRTHAILIAVAMAGAMLVLWAMGNPHVWTGAVAGFAAVAVRGWYMASELLEEIWVLDDTGLSGPYQKYAALSDIKTIRTLAGAVQVVTTQGDKHLIKYQADPQAVIDRINAARAGEHLT